jgi:hypothetical protein
MARHLRSLVVLLLMSGCAAQDAEIARRGRSELLGLSNVDLRMCAGHPNNEDKYPGGEIWMYEHGAVTPGGITVTPVIPVAGVSIGQPGGGYCRVQLRLVHDRVTEVAYAGATDMIGGEDAACASIIRTCLEYRHR